MKHDQIKHALHLVLQYMLKLLSVRAGLYFSEHYKRKHPRG